MPPSLAASATGSAGQTARTCSASVISRDHWPSAAAQPRVRAEGPQRPRTPRRTLAVRCPRHCVFHSPPISAPCCRSPPVSLARSHNNRGRSSHAHALAALTYRAGSTYAASTRRRGGLKASGSGKRSLGRERAGEGHAPAVVHVGGGIGHTQRGVLQRSSGCARARTRRAAYGGFTSSSTCCATTAASAKRSRRRSADG